MMELPASLQTEMFVKRGSVLLSDIFKSVGHPKFFVIVGMDEDCVIELVTICHRLEEE